MFRFLMTAEQKEEYRKKTYAYRKEFLYRPSTPHDWMFPYTGTEDDFTTLFAGMLLCPLFVFLIIGAVHLMSSEYEARMILLLCYGIIDIFTLFKYIRMAFQKRKEMREGESDEQRPYREEDFITPPEFYDDDL